MKKTREFWASLLSAVLPIIGLSSVAYFNIFSSSFPWSYDDELVTLLWGAGLCWCGLVLITAIIFSIWVKGETTSGLWIGLLISIVVNLSVYYTSAIF